MWLPILLSFSLMLSSAYLDNIRGPLLPLLTQTLNLSYRQSSWFLSIGNLFGVLTTLLMIRLIRIYRERKATYVLLSIALFGVFVSQCVVNFFSLVVLGGFLGASIATLGAMGNILIIQGVPQETRSRWMSGLHMMYGLGSVLAPLIVGWMLEHGYSWKSVFALGIVPIGSLFLFSLFKFPPLEEKEVEAVKAPRLTAFHWLAILAFAIYVSAEVQASNWMVTYLTVARGFSIAKASEILSGFFLAMGLGRFSCLLFLNQKIERKVIVGGQILFILFFFLGLQGFWLGFSLAGVLGPYFPVFVSRMTVRHPHLANRITLVGLSLSQMFLVFSHQLMGFTTDKVGIGLSFYMPIATMLLSLSLTLFYFNRE